MLSLLLAPALAALRAGPPPRGRPLSAGQPLSSRRRFLTTAAPTALAFSTSLPALAQSDGIEHQREVSLRNATFGLALGVSAVGTGVRGLQRSKAEKGMAEEMRDAQTTIKDLRELAEAGEPLPDVCIVKGTMRAEGPLVTPVVESTAALRGRIGTVNQPENIWLQKAEMFGALKGLASPLTEAVDKPSEGQISPDDVAFATTSASGAPLPVDAASLARRQTNVSAGTPCVLSELLVQRLFVNAYEQEDKNSDGDVTRRYNVRKARGWSYNVHYARQQSSGLQIEGRAGELARVRLPDFNFRSGEPPPLFLPAADVLREAVDDFVENIFKWKKDRPPFLADKLDTKTSPFTFISRFVALDDSSSDDAGGFFGEWDYAAGHALDQLAAQSPSSDWVWSPQGFYDKPEYALREHSQTQLLEYTELKERLPQARRPLTLALSPSLTLLRSSRSGFRRRA